MPHVLAFNLVAVALMLFFPLRGLLGYLKAHTRLGYAAASLLGLLFFLLTARFLAFLAPGYYPVRSIAYWDDPYTSYRPAFIALAKGHKDCELY